MTTIRSFRARHRFPTRRARSTVPMQRRAPDYRRLRDPPSETMQPDGLAATGLTFTIRARPRKSSGGGECARAVVVGRRLEGHRANMGAFWRAITPQPVCDGYGPVQRRDHLATAAVRSTRCCGTCGRRPRRKPVCGNGSSHEPGRNSCAASNSALSPMR